MCTQVCTCTCVGQSSCRCAHRCVHAHVWAELTQHFLDAVHLSFSSSPLFFRWLGTCLFRLGWLGTISRDPCAHLLSAEITAVHLPTRLAFICILRIKLGSSCLPVFCHCSGRKTTPGINLVWGRPQSCHLSHPSTFQAEFCPLPALAELEALIWPGRTARDPGKYWVSSVNRSGTLSGLLA